MNRFFTVLFIPEKTSHVRKFIIPAAYLRIALILGFIGLFFIAFMVYDYIHVMKQLDVNRKLEVENRQLRQTIQGYTVKLATIDDTLKRIETFSTKLRIITDQAGDRKEELIRETTPSLPGLPMDDHSTTPDNRSRGAATSPDAQVPMATAGIGGPEGSEELPDAEEILDNFLLDPAASTRPELDQPEKTNSFLKKSRMDQEFQKELDREISQALEEEFRSLKSAFASIRDFASNVEVNVQSLANILLDQRDYLQSMPTLKPTRGWYTSGFGMRLSPYTGRPAMHEGLDIANHHGSTIFAPADGVISFAGTRPGYGRLITLDHGYGIQTQFGHLYQFYVKAGDRVQRGQKIGAVGNSGRSTGPHVHYEVRANGIPVDPYPYILHE